MTCPEKLIFLDIDGVLNNANTDFRKRKHVVEESLLEKLGKILEAVPDSVIVLSSSWRLKEGWREMLKEKFDYLSCTPVAFNRCDEIVYWLERNTTFTIPYSEPEKSLKLFTSEQFPQEAWLLPERLGSVTHFIVIDDTDLTKEKSQFTGFIKERFVHVDRKVGLSDSDVKKAIDLLMIR